MGKRLTQEQFVAKVKAIHGEKFDLSLAKYVSYKEKVVIICPKHGHQEISPASLFVGCECVKCGEEKTAKSQTLSTDDFVRRSKIIHNNFYGYSSVEYVSSAEKVKIFCSIHQKTFLQSPSDHLKGMGCRLCGNKKVGLSNTHSKEKFISKSQGKYGNFFDYSLVEYQGGKVAVKIICPIHGIFEQTPHNHKRCKCGCPDCGQEQIIRLNTKDTKTFVKEAQIAHNNEYIYDLVEYKGVDHKIKVICPKHGVFNPTASNHLNNLSGCPTCNKAPGWSRSKWIEFCKGGIAKLYVIKCWNEREEFIKIGITGQTLRRRFYNKSLMPYNYTLLKLVKSKDAAYIYDLENRVQRMLSDRKYQPLIPFSGQTECFTHLNVKNKTSTK